VGLPLPDLLTCYTTYNRRKAEQLCQYKILIAPKSMIINNENYTGKSG
jgi:hypothetical protein